MTLKPFRASHSSPCGRLVKVATLLLALSAASGAGARAVRQSPFQRSEDEQTAEIAGVKFTIPREFRLEHPPDPAVAFMTHPTGEVALFVAVPDGRVDDSYLSNLSDKLTHQFLPRLEGVTWKILGPATERKTSACQIGAGTLKGLGTKRFVQVDYVILKSQGRNEVVGSIAVFGDEREANLLYNLDGREYSFPGWRGLFQLVTSITGESYEDGSR